MKRPRPRLRSRVTDEELKCLIDQYQAGYSESLNYEDITRDFSELNRIRWAREHYQKLAAEYGYKMAKELLERRQNEISTASTSQ